MDTRNIAAAFDFDGEILTVEECLTGHISKTFLVTTADATYIVQQMNKEVFQYPERVMENVVGVTNHIRKKIALRDGDIKNGTLQFIPSGEHYYHIDEEGEYWRAYRFVEGTCYQSCPSPEVFEKVGEAFGQFQSDLSDYDATSLFTSIPDFHNTAKRLEAFERAVFNDDCKRAGACAAEIAFIRTRREACSFITDGITMGQYPIRVTHNDTKLNNVILDPRTGEPRTVIDLDTVMPGSLLYDFGDAIRFGASTAAEDETDLDRVELDVSMFEAFTKGFLKRVGNNITREELLALPESARIIALEQAIRFLTDYLSGDVYFRTTHEGHNLERARNQMKLVSEIEAKRSQLNDIIQRYL